MVFFAVISFAQSLDGVKICIDPGHGGHTSDDRPPGPESTYWESEGNWFKSQHAKEILTSLGATVIVTRDGNEDSDDPGLSVRAGIANANNVDLFHSIHSKIQKMPDVLRFLLLCLKGSQWAYLYLFLLFYL